MPHRGVCPMRHLAWKGGVWAGCPRGARRRRRGGAAVVRLDLEGWHYVLLTRIEGGDVYLFDPYYHEGPFDNAALRVTDEHPCSYNRIVPVHYFEREEISVYSLGPFDTREAILLFNTDTELTEDKTVEYFI